MILDVRFANRPRNLRLTSPVEFGNPEVDSVRQISSELPLPGSVGNRFPQPTCGFSSAKIGAILRKDPFCLLLDIATRLEKWIQSSNAAGSLPNLAITETIDEVIIYHSDGLHVGINNRGTNETESALLEVLAECIGFE